jgi:hypothetical protein
VFALINLSEKSNQVKIKGGYSMPATTMVACKLPQGVILRIMQKTKQMEAGPAGGREVEVWRPTGEQIQLNGGISGAIEVGMHNKSVINGWGITLVPNDFWETWLDQNKDSSLLESGVLFAADKEGDIRAEINQSNKDKVKCGMEAMDPANPPMAGLPSNFNMRVTVADNQRVKPEPVELTEFSTIAEAKTTKPVKSSTPKRNGRVRRASIADTDD